MRVIVAAGLVLLAWAAGANLRAEEAPVEKTEAKTAEADAPKAEGLVDAPEDLAKAIAEGVTLLDEKKYRAFVDRFVHPEEKKQAQDANWDEIAAEFGKEKAGELLAILKVVAKAKVKLSDEGKTAVFHFKPTEGKGKDTIRFGKFENAWYIHNH